MYRSHCNCARRRVPESEQTAFVMITDLLWLNRQLKYIKENKTIRLINNYRKYVQYLQGLTVSHTKCSTTNHVILNT